MDLQAQAEVHLQLEIWLDQVALALDKREDSLLEIMETLQAMDNHGYQALEEMVFNGQQH
jgi:hypothetical protein